MNRFLLLAFTILGELYEECIVFEGSDSIEMRDDFYARGTVTPRDDGADCSNMLSG